MSDYGDLGKGIGSAFKVLAIAFALLAPFAVYGIYEAALWLVSHLRVIIR